MTDRDDERDSLMEGLEEYRPKAFGWRTPWLGRERGKKEAIEPDLRNRSTEGAELPGYSPIDPTESLDLSMLLTTDVTTSGSFDIRGEIWTTTLGKVIQALPIPAILVDQWLDITLANEACARIGSHYEEIMGAPFDSLFHNPNDSRHARAVLRTTLADRKPRAFKGMLKIEQSTMWGRMTFRSIRIMKERYVLVLIEDLTLERQQLYLEKEHNEALRHEISRRKEAEERLEFERRHALSLLDSISEIIYVCDPKTHELLYVNKFLHDLLGKDPVGGTCYKELWHFDHPCANCSNDMATVRNIRPKQLEMHNPRLERDYLVNCKMIRWPDGRDVSFQLATDVTKRKRIERALQESETKFRTLFNESRDAVYITTREGRLLDMNQSFLELFGYGEKDAANLNIISIYANPDDRESFRHHIEREGFVKNYEVKMRKRDGHEMVCLITAALRRSPDGKVMGYQGNIRDITEQRRTEQAIVRAKEEWERTFDTVPDLMAILDKDRRIVRLNRALADKLGLHPREAIGLRCYDWCNASVGPPANCPFDRMMETGKESSNELVVRKTGAIFLETVTPLHDEDGSLTGGVYVAREITEQKRLEKWLRRLATRDSLSNLYNRGHFLETLESTCETARRYKLSLSLGLCDIDRFKEVNDRYGHQTGDEVLATFGNIVAKELRRSDFAGRYGGDEFIVAFPHTSGSEAVKVMERIRERLEQSPIVCGSITCNVTCSIGVAEFASGRMNTDDLIRDADKALYAAKDGGRNRVLRTRK
jgi:diguanylate cyclase (GGDEF)-like protein/PAS domain S-box-containing protein